MAKKRVFLIDATAFCYRAFYAIRGLATSFGQPTNAIYGFVNMLQKILKEHKPDYLGVCFDVSRDTFRQKKFSAYKMQRPEMPQDLSSQIPFIKRIISAYGIRMFEKEGFEADDIIATINKKVRQLGYSVTVISSDKDILQLVDDGTQVYSPYKDEGILYDEGKVSERFGVEPGRIPDVIALMGDASDNIPNVPGIGERYAVELIQSFGCLDKLLENVDNIKQEKIKASIKNNLDTIKLNKELVLLRQDLDIDSGPEYLKINPADYRELFQLFKQLEFKKFLKDLPAQEEDSPTEDLFLTDDAQIKEALGLKKEIYLYPADGQLFFGADDKVFRIESFGEQAKSILSDTGVLKTGYDLKKIRVGLARHEIDLGGLDFDVLVAAYLLNPAKPQYDLLSIAWDYLPQVSSTDKLRASKAIGLIAELKPLLEAQLKEKSLFNLFKDLEMPLVGVLAEIELNGIKLDVEALHGLSREIEKRLAKLMDEIYAFSGQEFNINSPKQLRDVLFEKLKLPVVKKGKTGPSTDEEVLRTLAKRHDLPALLLEYRQLTKLKNTYVDVLPELIDQKTGKVHTSFNQTGTETGRLSSSNPNLQNIPVKTDYGRRIREAVIAFSADSSLFSCDYSQIELRILAHLSKDENLISAFKQDKDIHRITASLIYGLDGKDITEPMREMAKRVNFGIVYGLTSYGLSRDLGISAEEAQGFIDAYFLRYPGVADYLKEQIKKAEDEGFVTTLLGRRRYIPEINNRNQAIRQFAQRQAVNAPIQGSASDLIKIAMVGTQQKIDGKDLDTKMILQIHDELLFDVPKSETQVFAGLIRDCMEHCLVLDVPIKVDIKIGKNWSKMHSFSSDSSS
jgi:DNA polymerase-1